MKIILHFYSYGLADDYYNTLNEAIKDFIKQQFENDTLWLEEEVKRVRYI